MRPRGKETARLSSASLLHPWQRWVLVGVVTLTIGLLIIELRHRGVLEPLERIQYDWTTSALSSPEPAGDVYLVAIADADLVDWGWPVPDDRLSQITKTLLDAGASVVGVDLYRDFPVGEGRDELMDTLLDPRVVVISKLPDGKGAGIPAPPGVRAGFSDIPIDADGVARRALLLVQTQDGIVLSLPMQMAATFSDQPALQPAPTNARYLAFGPTVVEPLNPGADLFRNADTSGYQIIVDYQNALPIARRIAAADVLSQNGLDVIEGKAVIIGLTSHSVKDYFATPLNRSTGADFTFGAEIHAAIVQQLINYSKGTLSPLSSANTVLSVLTIFVSVFASASIAAFIRATATAFVLAAIGVIGLALGLSLFQKTALLLPVAPSMLGWCLGFIFAFATVASLARKQRHTIIQLFSSHLSEELSADIWEQRKRLLSGGKLKSRRLFVTALLADIEGSTRVGNAMDVDDFMAWISRILDRLGEIARDHGGFVEKYTGDGILVVFGAPLPSETADDRQADALSGARCAQAMRSAAMALNAAFPDQPDYRLRIALNSGDALGGTLGARGSMKYNVIGDTINVAARLESCIKSLTPDSDGFPRICMTRETACLIDPERDWPVFTKFLHDNRQTKIDVIEVS